MGENIFAPVVIEVLGVREGKVAAILADYFDREFKSFFSDLDVV